jgi:hypothetical protein
MRWEHLYNIDRHRKLTKAIIKDLKNQYDNYKRSKGNN